MKNDADGPPKYVFKVLDDTTRYVNELLSENEEVRSLLQELNAEKNQIESQLLSIRRDMERSREEKKGLEERLAKIEAENRQYSGRYVEVEQQNANLANLYVASYRLHSTLNRQEVLSVIEEIIINLIGSEELVIFELDPAGTNLNLVASFGVDQSRYRAFRSDRESSARSRGPVMLMSRAASLSLMLPSKKPISLHVFR